MKKYLVCLIFLLFFVTGCKKEEDIDYKLNEIIKLDNQIEDYIWEYSISNSKIVKIESMKEEGYVYTTFRVTGTKKGNAEVTFKLIDPSNEVINKKVYDVKVNKDKKIYMIQK